MTWTKLSDDYSDDCWTLSDAAFRLHTEALLWSNRKLLDCVIPKADLVRFSQRPDAAEELVAVGWWTEDGKFYVIRHHASYQRSRADVVKLQERNAANGAKGGRPKRREAWNPDDPHNPDGFPSGNRDGNPKGQDRTGQAGLDEEVKGSAPTSHSSVASFDPDLPNDPYGPEPPEVDLAIGEIYDDGGSEHDDDIAEFLAASHR